jgi:hypothetical protein
MTSLHAARALALLALTLCLAATPTPKPTLPPHPAPTPHLSSVPLHTEFVVEVNAKGQVVNVKSRKGCPNLTFNAQTYGNVLQMWIRHPDGSAEVGLYRVTYDYDPKTKAVARRISLVQSGGDWGDQPGAATMMMQKADEEARAAQNQAHNLPPLQNILDATPTPSPHP